jgi:predicted PurR-regulated permease PerM
MTISAQTIIKYLLVALLTLAFLFICRQVLMPLTVAVVIATLFLPLCSWLEKHKLPRGLVALLCVLLLIAALVGVATLVGWQIFGLTRDFDMIKQRSLETGAKMQAYILQHLGVSLERQEEMLNQQPPFVVRILQAFATSLSSIVSSLVLILVYVLFLLYYRSHLKQFILKLSGINQRDEMEKVIHIVAHVSQQYLVGLSKMIGCLWVMYGIGFSALGIENALFFAFLCGILEIVPFIGNLTGTSLTILVSAVQGESVPTLVGIAAVYALVQFIQGWILEPIIVGSQVKINPLFTIIALVVGQLLWGVPGIFLAIPLIAMFKIVCDHFESLKPIGFLIGETESRKNEVVVIQKVKGWIDKIPKK